MDDNMRQCQGTPGHLSQHNLVKGPRKRSAGRCSWSGSIFQEINDIDQITTWSCPTRKLMGVQHPRPAAQLRGVFRIVVLQDNCASGQQQAQNRQSHMYTIVGSKLEAITRVAYKKLL
eukprot:12911494-Prorocentrum_lima.AAC.1